jgi:hypothetical protein
MKLLTDSSRVLKLRAEGLKSSGGIFPSRLYIFLSTSFWALTNISEKVRAVTLVMGG